jgi:hypothetical protein
MANLFKTYEVAEYFDLPKPTVKNWSKAEGTWRIKFYKKLELIMAQGLAKKAEGMK